MSELDTRTVKAPNKGMKRCPVGFFVSHTRTVHPRYSERPSSHSTRNIAFVVCLPHCSAGILSAVYVFGLVACLALGSNGPKVFERSPPDVVKTDSLNVTWYGKIDGMEPMHQVRYSGVLMP